MHIIDNRGIECGECGSEDVEHVTYLNDRFVRCRRCKHEGEKSEVIPSMSTGSTAFVYSKDQPIKF